MSSRSAWSTEQVPGQVLLLLRNQGSKTHNGEIEGDREREREREREKKKTKNKKINKKDFIYRV